MKTFTPEFEVTRDAVICNYKSQYELMYSMARFQEYYENPYLKGRNFSRMELQIIQPDYYISWNGCNFPFRVLREMMSMNYRFDRHELVVFDFCSIQEKYIIGIHSNNRETLKHELAHASYSNCEQYRCRENTHTNVFQKKNPKKFKLLVNKLKSMGYDLSVIPDEIQAYRNHGWEKLGFDWTMND